MTAGSTWLVLVAAVVGMVALSEPVSAGVVGSVEMADSRVVDTAGINSCMLDDRLVGSTMVGSGVGDARVSVVKVTSLDGVDATLLCVMDSDSSMDDAMKCQHPCMQYVRTSE